MSGFRQILELGMRGRPRRHPFLLPLILAANLAAAPRVLSAPTADSNVTVMEPVFVEASSPDPWNYFTMPGFEVISHCPDSFNETYARALQLSTAARLAVLPPISGETCRRR